MNHLSLPEALRIHAQGALALTIAALVVVSVTGMSSSVQLLILVLFVTLLGLPHGGLDHLEGRRLLSPRLGSRWIPVFFISYLGLAGMMLLAWLVAPLPALALFLTMSAFHFGTGDVSVHLDSERVRPFPSWLEALARGSLPIGAPALFHPGEVSRLFTFLTPVGHRGVSQDLVTTGAAAWLVIVGPVLLFLFGSLIVQAVRERSDEAVLEAGEILVLTVLFAMVPPLVGFVVYFCVWHSARSILTHASSMEPHDLAGGLRRFVIGSVPTTLGAMTLGLVAWLFLAPQVGLASGTVRVVFVGLSCLTVPHMLLNWLEAGSKPTSRTWGAWVPGGSSGA